jgi:hypothetical protein
MRKRWEMKNVEMRNDLEILNRLTAGTVSNADVAPSASWALRWLW